MCKDDKYELKWLWKIVCISCCTVECRLVIEEIIGYN